MKIRTRKISAVLVAVVVALTNMGAHAADQSIASPVIRQAQHAAGSLLQNVPPNSGLTSSANEREPADKARFAAFLRNYVLTASVDGQGFRSMNMVVDSEGLAYSTSQQSFADGKGDTLWVHVSSYKPLVLEVRVRKVDKGLTGERARIFVEDLPVGVKAYALKESSLAVSIERLPDDVELRAKSILATSNVIISPKRP